MSKIQVLEMVLGNLLLCLYQWLKGIVLFFVPDRYMSKNVAGEVVLITGGGSGIGQLVAVGLAKLGARVVIWDVDKMGMEQTRKMAEGTGEGIVTQYCDVSNRMRVYEMAKKVKDEVGVVTVLINNAGIVAGKKFLDLDDEKIEQVFGVNTLAPMWTVKAFLPDMIKCDRGHLLFVSSVAGVVGSTHLTDYAASKFAIVGFEESLRLELRASGVTGVKTSVVCPFFIKTGLFEGVQSSLLPLLEPVDVANKIISSVRRHNPVTLIPGVLTAVLALKFVLPCEALFPLYDIFGGNELMVNFVGRKGKKVE